jgi:acyl carrier protein
MLNPIQIEEIVHAEIRSILQEKNNGEQIIRNDLKLNANLGITSLELARLVSLLEEKLNVDPFMEVVPITSIRTVSDFINAYQKMILN